MRQKREMLEHHPHLVTAELDELGGARPEEIAAIESYRAEARLDEPRQASQERRLAGPREAHDDEDLTFMDVEAHLANGTDEFRRFEIGEARLAAAAADELRRALSEDFPQIAAGKLDRPRRLAHARISRFAIGWTRRRTVRTAGRPLIDY